MSGEGGVVMRLLKLALTALVLAALGCEPEPTVTVCRTYGHHQPYEVCTEYTRDEYHNPPPREFSCSPSNSPHYCP